MYLKGLNMKKIKQIFAIILIILLTALYVSTLIFAITDNPHRMHMFAVSIAATIILPVLLYVYTMICRVASGRGTEVSQDIAKNIISDIESGDDAPSDTSSSSEDA